MTVMQGTRADIVSDFRVLEKARQRARAFTLLASRRINFSIVVYSVFMHVEVDLH